MSAKKTTTKNIAKTPSAKAAKKAPAKAVKATNNTTEPILSKESSEATKAKTTARKSSGKKNVISKQGTTKKTAQPAIVNADDTKKALENTPITPPAKGTSVSPALKQSKAPAIKQSKAPAIKEVNLPMAQDSTCIPCAIPDTRTALGPNPYVPQIATVVEIIEETENIKTFRVVLDDAKAMQNIEFGAGQVGQLSIFGVGEATFVISSPPSQKDFLQFSVMRVGELTRALHKLSVGDKIGVRAPLGNAFPCANWQGKDLFFIGGGIGMAPIRSIMLHTLENHNDYGKISLLYGARTPKDMAFSYELESWLENPNLDCTLTIDIPFGGWDHKVGLIPDVLTGLGPDPNKTVAIICGPPIMITFTVKALIKMGFSPENIITTLEKRMKCGIGICGRCNLGDIYVCVDGPVFSWAQLQNLPPEL